MKQVIEWSLETLESLNYKVKSKDPQLIQETPWSYVGRFETSSGYIYLKQTPELIALEHKIIKLLRSQFNAGFPEVIAENSDLNCFLMKDAGVKLRDLLKQKFEIDLILIAIDKFTTLQIETSKNIDVFLDIGVPDWRIEKIPSLFDDFILKNLSFLKNELDEAELQKLKLLTPKIQNLSNELSDFSIKETIVQPDFNDNNILIYNSNNITIIDLGEISISHPFFSLINFLHVIKKHHGLTEQDPAFVKIKEACLKNFAKYGSKENLNLAFELAKKLMLVYAILAHARLIEACGKEKLQEFQHERLIPLLKELIVVTN